MLEHNDDAARDLVQRAHRADPHPPALDVRAGLADVLDRVRRQAAYPVDEGSDIHEEDRRRVSQHDAARAAAAKESTTVLLRAVGEREPPAWEELITRYSRLVRSTVASFRLQEADAEDAVQNTWLRLMERMDKIRDPRCLGGWLATTAGRECLALIRCGRREAPDDAAADQLIAVESEPEPKTAVGDDAARRAVNAAVRELPRGRQQLIHALFYQPDCSYAEVSQLTGIPQGSIGPTRRRALRELREVLEQRGFGPPGACVGARLDNPA